MTVEAATTGWLVLVTMGLPWLVWFTTSGILDIAHAIAGRGVTRHGA